MMGSATEEPLAFSKGRVPSQKGTFSVVNEPSKGHIRAVNGRKGAQLAR